MTWWNPLTWFTDETKAQVSETPDYDPRGACSETGHAYDYGERTHYGYFARRNTWATREHTKFTIEETYWFECPKCGQTDHREETVGSVVVEDGEIVRAE